MLWVVCFVVVMYGLARHWCRSSGGEGMWAIIGSMWNGFWLVTFWLRDSLDTIQIYGW